VTGKTSHQPLNNNTSPNKTWVDIIKGRGFNVQIVRGNGNLGLTTPTIMRGERCRGVAWRLIKKREEGERGVMGCGKDGLEIKSCGENTGGKIDKNGRSRVADREEPGMVASVQAGYLDQIT
jgi:hypothetical protein